MIKMALAGFVCFLFLMSVAALPASTQAKWKGKIVKEGDVTIVLSTREPIYREPILILKEELVWVGGGEARFRQNRRRCDANIYVGDIRQSCVKVFDKAGAYMTIGRGQGRRTKVG
jgi:hypothetical protein